MKPVVSCGVLVLSRSGRLLLGHATGSPRWDIPKGIADPGEAPRAAAVRETAEETGLRLDAADLLDLGRFDYRPDKSLHLFATLIENPDTLTLSCTSLYQATDGRWLPEFDRYRWAALDEVRRLCARNMIRVLTVDIDLPALHARLVASPAA